MLNPLTDWEPGALVRYHGSLADLHGIYAVHLCTCRRCDHSHGSVRFRLLDEDGAEIVSCARSTSVAPCHEDAAPQPRQPRPARQRRPRSP